MLLARRSYYSSLRRLLCRLKATFRVLVLHWALCNTHVLLLFRGNRICDFSNVLECSVKRKSCKKRKKKIGVGALVKRKFGLVHPSYSFSKGQARNVNVRILNLSRTTAVHERKSNWSPVGKSWPYNLRSGVLFWGRTGQGKLFPWPPFVQKWTPIAV